MRHLSRRQTGERTEDTVSRSCWTIRHRCIQSASIQGYSAPIEETIELEINTSKEIAVFVYCMKGIFEAFAPLVALVTNADGTFNNHMFFWLAGSLSSFLDNAPTYLAFFNLAGGDPMLLMNEDSHTLMAISMGSVFMGSMTYIGNAPNFMTISIVQERGVKMPSFFGYMIWSVGILVPTFFLMNLFFI